MNYEEIKKRLMEDLRVVGCKLAPDERDKNRNKAIGQNGNDGLVYLADIKYWKPVADNVYYDFHLANGEYKIFPQLNYKVIYEKSTLTIEAKSWGNAVKIVCKHHGSVGAIKND